MGKEEIENFSLRVFIFSLREICISTNNIVSLQSGFKPYPKRGSHKKSNYIKNGRTCIVPWMRLSKDAA